MSPSCSSSGMPVNRAHSSGSCQSSTPSCTSSPAATSRVSGAPASNQTTALVSEAYVQLVGQREVHWQNRAHFFAIAAQVMRRILVDNARRELRPKHGAGQASLPLVNAEAVAAEDPAVDRIDALALDAALRKLETFDPNQARVVEFLRWADGR